MEADMWLFVCGRADRNYQVAGQRQWHQQKKQISETLKLINSLLPFLQVPLFCKVRSGENFVRLREARDGLH